MTSRDDILDSAIRQSLERWSMAGETGEVDLWPTIIQRLRAQGDASEHVRPRRRWGLTRRAVGASLVCVLLAVCGITVAAAASPSVRDVLHRVVPLIDNGSVSTGTSAQGAPLYMSPVPHFSVFYPSDTPAEMVIRGTGHPLPGGLRNTKPSLFDLSYVCPTSTPSQACGSTDSRSLIQLFPPEPNGEAFFPAVVSPLVEKGIEAVWFGFHALLPATTYVSIGEWSASQYAAPTSGETLTIGEEPAHLQQTPDEISITLVRGGTAIDLQTNLDRAGAISFTETLQMRRMDSRAQKTRP
jgi:hypothetical protein